MHYFFSHNFCQNGWIFIDTGDVKTSQCGGRGEINQQGDFGGSSDYSDYSRLAITKKTAVSRSRLL